MAMKHKQINQKDSKESTDYQINLANDKGGIFYHPSKYFFFNKQCWKN